MKYKVLIIDNEEEVLFTLKKLLQKECYTVETTKGYTNAIEKIKNDKYHIILIDIELSINGGAEMGGVELLKEIKKYDAMTQIIMMTENSNMDKILSSLEYGANDYIYKPLENTEFIMEVIDYSVQKLNRWREVIIQLVK